MKITLDGHQRRADRTLRKWEKIAQEYLEGKSVIELSKKYGYSRAYFYMMFKKLNERDNQVLDKP
jgi:Mor family transcriptional regulator